VHRDRDAPLLVLVEAQRLDVRIDLRELPRPVGAHVVAAVHPPALEGVRPVDVGMHRGKDGVDVAAVERVV
jgi:hypothetical protein